MTPYSTPPVMRRALLAVVALLALALPVQASSADAQATEPKIAAAAWYLVGARCLDGQRQGEENDDGGGECSAHHRRRTIGRHHPAAAHTCVASRSASAPAAARQSSSESRYA